MKLAPIGVFGAIAFSVGTYGIAMLLPLAKLLGCLYGGLVVFLSSSWAGPRSSGG